MSVLVYLFVYSCIYLLICSFISLLMRVFVYSCIYAFMYLCMRLCFCGFMETCFYAFVLLCFYASAFLYLRNRLPEDKIKEMQTCSGTKVQKRICTYC